jgi:hypothetical protein
MSVDKPLKTVSATMSSGTESLQGVSQSTATATESVVRTHTDEQYWQSLGEFIEAFASFEFAMSVYLRSEAKIEYKLALIFCRGLNLDQKKAIIKDIWKIRPPVEALKAEVLEVFSRSQKIAEVRNSMLHFGSFVNLEGDRITSDAERTIGEAREFRISPESLLHMRLDILKCAYHLLSLANQEFRPLSVREGLIEAIRNAWLYTPPSDQPPKFHKQERSDRKRRRGRPGPPESSPE